MARIRPVEVATVRLWGRDVGAVAWNADRGLGEFEYDPAFVRQGIDVAPLVMPLRTGIFSFPSLRHDTFHSLPGLLADSLPDRFGNRIIDTWLARQGRRPEEFTPVERLCYMGIRGMGALEFRPAIGPATRKSVPFEVAELTELVRDILRHRSEWVVNLKGDRADALNTIIRIGTSAAGNRAKAVIAWNPQTGEVRSGQAEAPKGFEPWILKFDGVTDDALGDPKGYGRVEYAYHQMAVAAGIRMSACHLLEEQGRAHFLTRRFDRDAKSEKLHMQSLCALAHYDFNASGEYGYEQALSVVQQLNLGHPALQELYRRMLFNVLARNQDDHTRNIAFLMDPQGAWTLSPAYDVVWAYNPQGKWTDRHQMTINGKRTDFNRTDLLSVADTFGIKDAEEILGNVADAVYRWTEFASACGVDKPLMEQIGKSHRLHLVKS